MWIKENAVVSDAAWFVKDGCEFGESNARLHSSLLSDLPGSLVCGVRNCEELPKLESCLCCSSVLGFRLKKLLILPVVVFLLGLAGEAVAGLVFGTTVSGVASLGWVRHSMSPFLMSRGFLPELIWRHQLDLRDSSDRVTLLSPLILLVSHCCSFEPSRVPLAV